VIEGARGPRSIPLYKGGALNMRMKREEQQEKIEKQDATAQTIPREIRQMGLIVLQGEFGWEKAA
jgi:outer membrane protein TolC